MATITEDYVSFEVSKLLKNKGFNGEFHKHYYGYNPGKEFLTTNSFNPEYDYPAPTLQMAMKWLREIHGLHISLEPCYDYDSMHVVFLAFVQNVADVHEFMDGRKNIATHPNAEKSYELAIKYCLEKLI